MWPPCPWPSIVALVPPCPSLLSSFTSTQLALAQPMQRGTKSLCFCQGYRHITARSSNCTALHCTTLHYTSLHSETHITVPPALYTSQQTCAAALQVPEVSCPAVFGRSARISTALQLKALHVATNAPHCIMLNFTALSLTSLHFTELNFTSLHCTALHCTEDSCTSSKCI